MIWRYTCALVALSTVSILAQEPATTRTTERTDTLPVRRVVLYKTGVGYFEHLGTVRDRQDVAIRFTSAQLNDVLKSLTTIDLGEGQITGISYNSVAPMEQRLRALRLPLNATASTLDLLASLRGARLEIGGGTGPIVGRLLSVDRHTRGSPDEAVTVDTLSIVTDNGEVRSFELTPTLRIRLLDRDLRQDLARYLDVVGSAREQDVRQMIVSTSGSGERQLFVSYVSEVPIWKTTYRLVLRDNSRPLLQGWAIVDNTIGEDWTDVELSLVAGAPQSFVQNISQPYYGRRPTVPLPAAALLAPQTHQAALEVHEQRAAGDAVPSLKESVEVTAPGGVVGGRVGGLPPAPPALASARAEPAAYSMIARQAAAATSGALADLFEYRLKERVTLQKNQSALVPIVNAEIAAEKVAIWNRAPGSGRPLRAVWLTNTSGLTLDGGSMSVIDANAFAGEGLIEPLKPGERRLFSYAADVGVLVDAKLDAPPGRLVRVRARDGVVIQQTEERATWTYRARSEESTPVVLIVEHPQRPGWKLAPDQKPVESTPGVHRFRLTIDPGKEVTLVVREMREGESRIAIGDFDETRLAVYAAQGASAAAIRKAIAPIAAKRAELASLERQLTALKDQQQSIVLDQQRVRENMRALRGSDEEKQLILRYTRQLDEQENKLEALRSEVSATTARRDRSREELNTLIGNFEFDAS